MSESNDIRIAREQQNGRCVCGHNRTDHDFIYAPHSWRWKGNHRPATIIEPCRGNDVCPCRDWMLDQDQPGDEPTDDLDPGEREYWESKAAHEDRNEYQGGA